MAISLAEMRDDLNAELETFSVEDKKKRGEVLYYKVVGDQGTLLTYKAETFLSAVDDGKITFVDKAETKFTIERNNEFDLW